MDGSVIGAAGPQRPDVKGHLDKVSSLASAPVPRVELRAKASVLLAEGRGIFFHRQEDVSFFLPKPDDLHRHRDRSLGKCQP